LQLAIESDVGKRIWNNYSGAIHSFLHWEALKNSIQKRWITLCLLIYHRKT
jgi:hypothetical protein